MVGIKAVVSLLASAVAVSVSAKTVIELPIHIQDSYVSAQGRTWPRESKR